MATEVASIFARVGADLSGFHAGMNQFNSAVNSAGGAFRNFTTGIIQGIGQAFGQASIRAIREFGDVVGSVIGSAADMEQGVADITATMGLAGDETARVSKLISDLGIDPKLKVTSTEAAGAIEMLAKNGLDLEEIMGGAARATVLLSNSTGGDFATSADIATSAMAQFKIRAEDMSGIVDQITGVTRNSKFDIDDYRLAISQAGGVAASVGVDFTDFNAVIAAISPLFASGSDAGTSFKTFLQRLVPDTEPATEAMRQLGIITADGTNRFFDASGQMRSMSEIAGVLQDAFGGLTEAQKIQAATNIFGTDAMRAAFALADSGAGTIDKLKTSIGNTSAEESAATRMDTLKGAWEIFTGIVESLSIKFGTSLLPALRMVTDSLIELSGRVGPQVEAWGAQLGERLKIIAGAAVELLNVGLDRGLLAIFEPLPDGTRALDKLWEAFGMSTEQAKGFSERLIITVRVVGETASAITSLIATIAGIVAPVARWIDQNIGLENALRGVALFMAGGFVASIISTVATIVSAVGSVATFVASLTGLGSVATTIGGAVVAAISAIGGPITLLIAAVGALALAWHNNWWDIQGKTKAAWDAIKSWTRDGIDSLKWFFTQGGWFEIGQNMTLGIVNGIRAGWNWVTDAAKGVAQAALDAAKGALGIQSPSRAFAEVGRNIGAGLSGGITASRALVTDSMGGVVSALAAAWNQQSDAWRLDAMHQLQSIVGSLRDQFRIFEDASIAPRRLNEAGRDLSALVERINGMAHEERIATVANLAPETRQSILRDYRIFEDASIAPRRVDVYVHGESSLPTDRAKLRELARALQSEFVLSGARVAVA